MDNCGGQPYNSRKEVHRRGHAYVGTAATLDSPYWLVLEDWPLGHTGVAAASAWNAAIRANVAFMLNKVLWASSDESTSCCTEIATLMSFSAALTATSVLTSATNATTHIDAETAHPGHQPATLTPAARCKFIVTTTSSPAAQVHACHAPRSARRTGSQLADGQGRELRSKGLHRCTQCGGITTDSGH